MDKWQELSYQLMTEESGGESAEEIICHSLPWRSDSKYIQMQMCACMCTLLVYITAAVTYIIYSSNKVHQKA